MAAIASSPWGAKPGAWALDSEESEAELLQQPPPPVAAVPAADFPSLAAAAATKPTKKKKGQTISLAEFTTGSAPVPYSRPSRPAQDDNLLVLPKGPRERSAEELDGSRLGGGFRSYGGGGAGRYGDDSSRRGGFDESGRREPLPPSRADEIDDWGAGKKPMSGGGGFDRRERGDRSEGFFSSQSKADESDNWGSNKSSEPRRFGNGGGSDFPRERRGFRAGYEGLSSGPGADSDRWGRKREDDVLSNGSGGGADTDRWGRKREDDVLSNGSGAGSGPDRWGKRREEDVSSGISSSRPKLVLQPRTLPVTEVVVRPRTPPVSEATVIPVTVTVKPRGANPFGDARPREEVLKEKGQDWKEIDEKLESLRIKETDRGEKGEGAFAERSFGGSRASLPEDKTERSWRKNDAVPVEATAAAPSSEEKDETADEEAAPTEA